MKSIIKIFLILIFVASFLFVLVADTEARQGCCSWHGGVCTYTCPDGFSVGYMCCDGTSLSATCAPYYPSCPPVFQKPKIEIKLEPKIEPKTDYTILATAFAEVIRIVDGDTIEVKFSDNTIEKARLIGIDTPETVDPRKSVECFGKEASAKMKELVEGKTVKLEKKSDENRDVYDRLLRYVYVGDVFVNAEMIKQGYAYAYTKYTFDSELMEEFKQYEQEAKEMELGLWSPDTCAEVVNSIEDTKIAETQENDKDERSWFLTLAVVGGIMYVFGLFTKKLKTKK